MSEERKFLYLLAALLFLGGAGTGGYGAWVAADGEYTETTRGPGSRTVSKVVEGPEAVFRGWKLMAGATPALAWAALLTWPPVPRARAAHFALLALALLGLGTVFVLIQPPWELPGNRRALAFHVQLGVYVLAAHLIAFFGERGAIAAGVAFAGTLGALLWNFGLNGLESVGLATMAFFLIGLHVAAWLGLWRMSRTKQLRS